MTGRCQERVFLRYATIFKGKDGILTISMGSNKSKQNYKIKLEQIGSCIMFCVIEQNSVLGISV